MSENTPLTKARALFANQGMHANAEFIAALHDNALDYLRQAPALTLAFGVKWNTKADRLYIATRIGGPIQRGERLRNVMAAAGLSFPLRKLKPNAITPSCAKLAKALTTLPPSVLSQAIPDGTGRQRKWIAALKAHGFQMSMRDHVISAEEFQWFAVNASNAKHEQEAADISDYICGVGPLNWKWTWARAITETELWHDRLAAERDLTKLPGAIQLDTCIDLSDYPDHHEIAGYEFFKLSTPGMIMEEGRRMRHCVGSYIGDVLSGKISLFSIRADVRRVATLQVVGGRCVQLKGFANKAVKKPVKVAVSKFLAKAA